MINRHVVAPDCEGGLGNEIVKILVELQCNLNGLHSKSDAREHSTLDRGTLDMFHVGQL